MPQRWPQPSEQHAREYRRALEEWDREPLRHVERGGFGFRDGYHGAYAERRRFSLPYARLRRSWPEGSGWPAPIYELPAEAEERHLRALRDRDLARSVDFALYNVVGPAADRIAVLAADAVITLEGVVPRLAVARRALETAWAMPGVRRVRDRLWIAADTSSHCPAQPRPASSA